MVFDPHFLYSLLSYDIPSTEKYCSSNGLRQHWSTYQRCTVHTHDVSAVYIEDDELSYLYALRMDAIVV